MIVMQNIMRGLGWKLYYCAKSSEYNQVFDRIRAIITVYGKLKGAPMV